MADLDSGLQLTPANDPEGARRASVAEPEPMTVEAIERDPFNMIDLPLPESPGLPLLDLVTEKAQDLRDYARDRAGLAESQELTDHWIDIAEAADRRFDEAFVKGYEVRAREAWQSPEFSHKTIDADPGTAVHLPVPPAADADLLVRARDWASDLERHADSGDALAAPMHSSRDFTREENMAAASARADELTASLENRLAPTPAMTVEPTPDERATLANEILGRMGDMHSHYDIDARDGGFALVRTFEIDDRMLGEYGLPSSGEQIFGWTKTLPEMHERIITQEGPHFAPELVGNMPAQTATLEAEPRPPLPEGPDYNFRPLASIEASIGEHLARAVDIVLGETMAVLVPDPGVTPEQARDLNRAYEEKLEARAVEGARLDDAAALDAVNAGIAHNQPRDMPGAEVKLAETVYDRYPGLTRERFGDADSLQRERTSDFEIGDGFGMKL